VSGSCVSSAIPGVLSCILRPRLECCARCHLPSGGDQGERPGPTVRASSRRSENSRGPTARERSEPRSSQATSWFPPDVAFPARGAFVLRPQRRRPGLGARSEPTTAARPVARPRGLRQCRDGPAERLQSRSTRRRPRPGVHDSTASLVASAFRPVMTTSVSSGTSATTSAAGLAAMRQYAPVPSVPPM